MSALQSFLDAKGLKKEALYWASQRLEAHDEESLKKAAARAAHKAAKKEGAALPEKPKSGRGITQKQIEIALAGKALTKKVRGKFLRAANALLEKAKKDKATMQDLFGEVKALAGKKVVAKKPGAK